MFCFWLKNNVICVTSKGSDQPAHTHSPGLENSTRPRPLVFTSALGCRASENFDISSENQFFPIYGNNNCDAGQVPILRYFEA